MAMRLLAAVVLLALLGGAFLAGARLASPPSSQAPGSAHAGHPAPGAREWTCSMHPQVRLPGPGRCPICGMALVPAAPAGAAPANGVALAPQARRIAGVHTAIAERRPLERVVRTVGRVEAAEPLMAYVTARATGRIERVYADYTGVEVRKGDHLVDIYAPDLVVAQEELLAALRLLESGKGLSETWQAQRRLARRKLLLLGLTEEQIDALEKERTAHLALTVHAPRGGTVLEKHVREGAFVETGAPLYTIADLSRVWVLAQIYEDEVPLVRPGQEAQIEVEGAPEAGLRGRIAFVSPTVDDATRTVAVRIDVDNAARALKPGMFAKAAIPLRLAADGRAAPVPPPGRYVCPMHPEVWGDVPGPCRICGMPLEARPTPSAQAPGAADPLVVPASAVLSTGVRHVVYVERSPGVFEAVEVRIGPRAQGAVPVLSGLEPGDVVVAQGAFLVDSQAQIEGKPSLLFPAGTGAAPAAGAGHAGHR